jgi:hypothetical protein
MLTAEYATNENKTKIASVRLFEAEGNVGLISDTHEAWLVNFLYRDKIVTCRRVRVTKLMGSSSDDWIQ